jgi:hypothetical protein
MQFRFAGKGRKLVGMLGKVVRGKKVVKGIAVNIFAFLFSLKLIFLK